MSMVSIALRFQTGRYHATPWDQHVNEGGVEWPPSPWRILRALVATWHLKAREDIEAGVVEKLVEALAQALPVFRVPPARGAHTRHYMPIGEIDKRGEKTTKIFDTFLHLGSREPVVVTWPDLTLSGQQAAALKLLLSRMSYFGRAESWVEARLMEGDEPDAADQKRLPYRWESNVFPLPSSAAPAPDQELVRVLCAQPSADIASWRSRAFEEEVERRLAERRRTAQRKGKRARSAKLTKAEMDKLNELFPENLMDALQADTSDLHQQGWSLVPGTRWVDYLRPRDLLLGRARTSPVHRSRHLPTAARFAVASQVPPRLTECLSFADRVRRALMSRSDAAPVFSGKDAAGVPLTGNRHAFIFPEANGAHGRITHVTLYAPMGFNDAARRAMDSLREVWGHGGHPVQLVLLGVGMPEDFAGTNVGAGQCPLFVAADTWVSRTPFIPTRHAKTTRRGQPKLDEGGLQIGCPEHDLRRLLREIGLPEPVTVEPMESGELSGKRVSWLDFKTLRASGEGSRGMNRGLGFRLVFPSAVNGPIAVGYGAHFGMGVFGVPTGIRNVHASAKT